MLETLEPAPPDPILKLIRICAADARPGKIDLGVGVYKDAEGRTPIFRAVKEAERRLLELESSKSYLGMEGNPGFNAAMAELVFADAAPSERIASVQTPGGSGALRLLSDLVAAARPGARFLVSDPTWSNHAPVLRATGGAVETYPYFDWRTKRVRFDEMIEALRRAGPADVVLVHGCCHNPTGANLTLEQWEALTEVALERGFLPFVDIAYQGFAEALDADAAGLRTMAAQVPEMIVAASCSKNFGLYKERVGSAMVLAPEADRAVIAGQNLCALARVLYSQPPDHGAELVRMVLTDPDLRAEWEAELAAMQARMLTLRQGLAEALRARSNSDRFDYIAEHRGMFSLIGCSDEQIERLREEHAVYVVGGGRINLPGLTEARIGDLADALIAVGM